MESVDFGDDAPSEQQLAPVVPIAPRRRAQKEEPRDYNANPMQVATVGRGLPQSVEAEEALLSLAMMDGDDIVRRAEESGIRPASFYHATNGLVYEKIRTLWKDGKSTDISLVAEELKSAKQLEFVGGHGFLVQISSKIPTTAQAGYFIEKVRQLALQREFIRRATGAVEEAYQLTGEIDQFLEAIQHNFKSIADGSSAAQLEKLMARLYDPTKKLEKPKAIYLLAGTQIATPGNLTAIYSQAKTGKSSVVGAMMAATMTTPDAGHDTLGIEGPNYAKHAVLHFDTEQSRYDWQQLLSSSLRRVGREKLPEWLQSFNLTGCTPAENVTFIELAIRTAAKRFGGIHSVIIDGIADLVVDPNDSESCFPLITRLHALAIEHNTSIISVLHMNPGMETKGRGHLGSQLERKCESNLTLEKDANEVTIIYSTKQRGKSIKKDDAPSFRWNDDKMMHTSCATPEKVEGAGSTGGRGRPELYKFADYKQYIPAKSENGITVAQLALRCAVDRPITTKQMCDVVARWVLNNEVESIKSASGTRYRLAL